MLGGSCRKISPSLSLNPSAVCSSRNGTVSPGSFSRLRCVMYREALITKRKSSPTASDHFASIAALGYR